MTKYPETRGEYKAAILHNIYRLVQALELDDPSVYPAGIAQSIHHDTREFFNADRWKPRPVFDSARARIPLGEVLTFRVQHWLPVPGDDQGDERPGYVFVTGQLEEISGVPYSHDDGACFHIVPLGKRKSREHTYRVGYGRSLKVWKGRLTEAQASARPPFFEHEQTPRPQEARAS